MPYTNIERLSNNKFSINEIMDALKQENISDEQIERVINNLKAMYLQEDSKVSNLLATDISQDNNNNNTNINQIKLKIYAEEITKIAGSLNEPKEYSADTKGSYLQAVIDYFVEYSRKYPEFNNLFIVGNNTDFNRLKMLNLFISSSNSSSMAHAIVKNFVEQGAGKQTIINTLVELNKIINSKDSLPDKDVVFEAMAIIYNIFPDIAYQVNSPIASGRSNNDISSASSQFFTRTPVHSSMNTNTVGQGEAAHTATRERALTHPLPSRNLII